MPAGPATIVAVAVPVAASTCCAEWSHFDLEWSYCCYYFVVTLSPHFVAMNYWDFVGMCSLQPVDLLHLIATDSLRIAESSLVHFAVSNKRSKKSVPCKYRRLLPVYVWFQNMRIFMLPIEAANKSVSTHQSGT